MNTRSFHFTASLTSEKAAMTRELLLSFLGLSVLIEYYSSISEISYECE